MLSVKNLYLKFTKEFYTLNNINIEIKDGEHCIVLGEKESGKSSLIRVIAGLEEATKGEIFIKGFNVSKINFKTDVSLGYISSNGAYLEGKTVKQNLEYVLKIRKFPKDETEQKVKNALLTYSLENLQDVKISKLSAYDKLRVAIARLSLRPIEFFIIDDIFEHFSMDENKKLAGLIKDLFKENPNCSSIIAVNNLDIAKIFGGCIIKLKYGSIVEE